MEILDRNELVRVGTDFLSAINRVVNDTNCRDKRELFNTLDKIILNKGLSLGLHLPDKIGMGDESWFYTYPEGHDPLENKDELKIRFEHQFSQKSCYDGLNIEPSAMGAWHAYLFYYSPTIMPVYWHGGYIKRIFIFSFATLHDVIWRMNPEERSNVKGIEEFKVEDVFPNVVYVDNRATVTCCFWNDWCGLIRETMIIEFGDDNLITISSVNYEVLIKYNCGICY